MSGKHLPLRSASGSRPQSLCLVLLVVLLGAPVLQCQSLTATGGTNVTVEVRSSDDLYRAVQLGNGVRIRILSNIRLERAIFVTSPAQSVEGVAAADGNLPTLDCVGAILDAAFVVRADAEISIKGIIIGGCTKGALKVQGQNAKLTLDNITFRNNASPEQGATMLVSDGATVTGTGLEFNTNVASGSGDSSIIHVGSGASLKLTSTTFTKCVSTGSLISTDSGTFQGTKLSVDNTNRVDGDLFHFLGCGGTPNQITRSTLAPSTALLTVVAATAGRPGFPAASLPQDSSPALFSHLPKKLLSGCSLDLSGTTISGLSVSTGVIVTDGFGVDAQGLEISGMHEFDATTENATLISNANGWLTLTGCTLDSNTVNGPAIWVKTPLGPVVLSGGSMDGNKVSTLVYVEGTSSFVDGNAFDSAVAALKDLYWAGRALPASKAAYLKVVADIKKQEGIRDGSRRSSALMLSGVEVSGNTATGALIEGAGAAWDSGQGESKALVVVVSGSTLRDNAVGAGLLNTVAANVSLVTSVVTGNKVAGGPVVGVDGGVLQIDASEILNNDVSEGSVVLATNVGASYIQGSTFSGNIASDSVVDVEEGMLRVVGSSWDGNTATMAIVDVVQSEVDVQGMTGTANTAQTVLRLESTPLKIWNSRFTSNKAAPLLAVSSAPLFRGDPAVISNCTFATNSINPMVPGAVALVSPAASMPVMITNDKFLSNRVSGAVANSTGGLYLGPVAGSGPNVTIANSLFDQNFGALGGALWTSRATSIVSSQFTNNTATFTGGAIYAVEAPLAITPGTTISGNSAPSGGGLTCVDCDPLTLRSVDFIGNSADPSLVPNPLPITAIPEIPCGKGSGGAVCLSSTSSDATISISNFTSNVATLGGALYLENSCGDASGAGTPCLILLDRLNLDDNKASNDVASDLYATSTSGVKVCCTVASGGKECGQAGKQEELSCSNAPGSIRSLATSPVAILVTSAQANTAVVSGSTILTANVTLVDAAGQMVAVAPGGISLEIGSNSNDLVVIGNTSIPFNNRPSIVVTNFQVLPSHAPDNSEYSLVFTAVGTPSAAKISQGQFNITIPQCTLGQFLTNYRCLECNIYKGQYSLDPRVRCEPCPPSGNCTGGFLIPKQGYWQPNPLVPQLQKCPLDGGCQRGAAKDVALGRYMVDLSTRLGRPGGLQAVQGGITSVEAAFTGLQCGRGYTGRLCGVCDKGYGRWSTQCVKCSARALNSFYLFLAICFLVFIMAITIASHLRAALYKRPLPPPPPQEEEAEALDKRKVYDLDQILNDNFRKKLDARLDADQVEARQKEEIAAKQLEEAATNAERSSLHFSMLTALAKIMVSYVQIIGMARALELDIPTPLRRFLSNFDYTSSLSWLSLECSLRGSSFAKAVKRSILTACLPLMLMVFFFAFWFTKYLRRKARAALTASNPSPFPSSSAVGAPTAPGVPRPLHSTPPRSFLANRCITTFLQVAFYTYPLVTSTLFSLFDCRKLRKCNSEIECEYRHNNPTFWKAGYYWTQSYSTPCFHGGHLTVMLAFGLPAIAIFSIGVPLMFGISIWLRRRKLQEPRVLLRFGFLYWEYRQKCHYWEAVITARKLALLMTTIFLRYTGKYAPSIQIYTSLMVLMMAFLLQEAFRPFESELLNRMERLSLFASATTLVLMAYFLVGPISQTIRTTLAAVIMAINIACLLQFLSLIMWELWLWMLDKLGLEAPNSFKISDIKEVSKKLRGRWKDIRGIIVNEWVMPSVVNRLGQRHSAARTQLPAPPTQEDIHP